MQNQKFIPIPKKPNCQRNRQCVYYSGDKKIYYDDANDLAQKLGVTRAQARQYLNDSGTRYIADGQTGKVVLVNVKAENIRGILRQEFGINRITRQIKDALFNPNGSHQIKNRIYASKLIQPTERLEKVIVQFIFYVSFSSDEPIRQEDILDQNGNIDKDLLKQYVHEKKIVKRFERAVLYNTTIDEIEQQMIDRANRLQNNIGNLGVVLHAEFKTGSSFQNRELLLEDQPIASISEVYNLTEWINIEYNNVATKDNCCVVRLVENKYPKLYWKIKQFEQTDDNGFKYVLLKDFMIFCKKNQISYNIYDVNGKLLFSFVGYDKMGTISCIVHNSHIYPIKGGQPKRIPKKKFKIENIDDKNMYENINEKLLECLNSGQFPHSILIGRVSEKEITDKQYLPIRSFIVGDTKYISNPEYDECMRVLKALKISEYMTDDMKLKDIPHLLEKVFNYPDTQSFIPDQEVFKSSVILYKTPNFSNLSSKQKRIKTIDKNKCFPYCLSILPYLLRFDFRTHNIRAIDPKNPIEITDKNLYIVDVEYSTMLIPNKMLCTGYFLKECKNYGISFTLLEEWETETVNPYFRELIEMTWKLFDEKTFKAIWNRFIGTLEINFSTKVEVIVKSLFTKQASRSEEGFKVPIGNYDLVCDTVTKYGNASNRLPIAIQVKEMSRLILFKKVQELEIDDNDIIQINTDSISYLKKGKYPKGLQSNTLDGWKKSDFKPINDTYAPIKNEYISGLALPNMNNNTRILHAKYAGSGKTYDIINRLVPTLIKKGISYIVLTPTHPTLEEYESTKIYINGKEYSIECDIFQRYTLKNIIPQADYIIIDEVGFIDRTGHNFLYKLNRLGKSFELYGDFEQLLPINESAQYNQQHYLNYMFSEIDTKFINRRNNFTEEYYRSIIDGTYEYAKAEVKRWSTVVSFEAEYIISFRRSKIAKYYNAQMAILRDTYNYGKGSKIVCIKNTLALMDKNIFNGKEFTIIGKKKIESIEHNNEDAQNKDILDMIYTIRDKIDNTYQITQKQLDRCFDYAYALNIHRVQGKTINSYYWCDEDDKFLTPRMAYTIISRLKQE
jgi:hypothetical protein